MKTRGEGEGKGGEKRAPEETQEARDGETEEEWQREGGKGRGSLLPRDYGRKRKREGESKRVIALQQHLMASLERGREWRGEEEKA